MQTAVSLFEGTMALAAVYALINTGFVALYRTTGVINFAQGYFLAVGAYAATALATPLGYWPAFLVATVLGAVICVIVYMVIMRFLLGRPEFTKAIATLMLSIIIAQALAAIWGTNPRELRPPVPGSFLVDGVHFPWATVFGVGLAAALVMAFVSLVRFTRIGVRMRALAADEVLASYSGMRVHRLGAAAWAIAGAAAAVAGIVYAAGAGVSLALPAVGLAAFPAAVIGGIDSLGGVLVGGVLVAAVQTVLQDQVGAAVADAATYGVMVVALMFIPQGVLGRRDQIRV